MFVDDICLLCFCCIPREGMHQLFGFGSAMVVNNARCWTVHHTVGFFVWLNSNV